MRVTNKTSKVLLFFKFIFFMVYDFSYDLSFIIVVLITYTLFVAVVWTLDYLVKLLTLGCHRTFEMVF